MYEPNHSIGISNQSSTLYWTIMCLTLLGDASMNIHFKICKHPCRTHFSNWVLCLTFNLKKSSPYDNAIAVRCSIIIILTNWLSSHELKPKYMKWCKCIRYDYTLYIILHIILIEAILLFNGIGQPRNLNCCFHSPALGINFSLKWN